MQTRAALIWRTLGAAMGAAVVVGCVAGGPEVVDVELTEADCDLIAGLAPFGEPIRTDFSEDGLETMCKLNYLDPDSQIRVRADCCLPGPLGFQPLNQVWWDRGDALISVGEAGSYDFSAAVMLYDDEDRLVNNFEVVILSDDRLDGATRSNVVDLTRSIVEAGLFG